MRCISVTSKPAMVGHDAAVTARPRALDAETILSVAVGYSLDEACQHFSGVRLRTHVHYHRIRGTRQSLPPTSVWKSGAISISRLCVIRFCLRRGTSHKQTQPILNESKRDVCVMFCRQLPRCLYRYC
jgi:hypothetical protein